MNGNDSILLDKTLAVFGGITWRITEILISAGIMLLVVCVAFTVINKWDKEIRLKKGHWIIVHIAALVQGMISVLATGRMPREYSVSLAVLGGVLLMACITDLLSCQVYNFMWWITISLQAFILWGVIEKAEGVFTTFRGIGGEMSEGQQILSELAIYVTAQLILAGRIYGRADAYAFSVCALSMTSLGGGFVWYLCQMLLAYGMLFWIQVKKKNLTPKGNLKKPQPFLPYITLSFWCIIICCCFSD